MTAAGATSANVRARRRDHRQGGAAAPSGGRHARGRQHKRRWPRRVAAGVAGVAFAGVASAALYVWSLPSVAGAESRVARELATHHSKSVGNPPPARLATALVDTEDEHFYDNFLFNTATGVARVALHLFTGGPSPGGSTIEQQLAKMLYVPRQGVGAELEQVGLALRLDLRYSKGQILQMYLDRVYLGNGYYGAAAAARGYFGTSVHDLTWRQAAMLGGLPQAPSAYDPFRHRTAAKLRQSHVLRQLAANGHITASRAAADYAAPLGLRRRALPSK